MAPSVSWEAGRSLWCHDGDLVIGEVLYTGSGYVPDVAYTWGANGLVSERFLTGTPYSLWYHFGPQGETRYLTNMPVPPNPAAIVDSYLYTAYGEPVASSGTDPNPFQYGGQVGYYTGPGAGLVLCGARWYNPWTARWMTRDPIGYAGGADLYAYCGESPTVHADPAGKCVMLITGAIGALVGGGIGAFSAWRSGQNIWAGAGRGALLGGIAGLTGGMAGAGVAYLAGGGVIGGILGGAAGGFVGDSSAQLASMGLGWQPGGWDPYEAGYSATVGAVTGGMFWRPVNPPGETVTVAHWGGPSSWYQLGRANWWNQMLTGKWGSSGGVTLEVPRESLRYPRGLEAIKGLFGQRQCGY